MSWSPAQAQLLEAMGYVLYRQAGAAVAAGLVASPPRGGTEPAAAPDAATAPHTASAPGGERPPAPTRMTADDRLLQALRRAAGRDLAGVPLPPLAELRAGAAAKRALWRRLRALRRS